MEQIALVLLIVSSFLISYSNGSANVHTSDTYIVDGSGRVRLYHGLNLVMKGFPWYPSELLDPIRVANLLQWGINFIRLGMMWAGVEPEPQKYNVTYLNIMKNIIELLESNQIYVLLDMHQDVLSSRTGSYDGIPAWLFDRFPPPAHPYPWPLKSTSGSWFELYLTEACAHGFQCLYDNTAGAAESMGNFWRLVASTYKNHSNVLGYELINEPWAGNYLENPAILLPGIAGAKNLQPFYETIAKYIRSVDNDTLIFYEPVTWGVRLNGKYVGTGFTHVPGGDDYRNRSVLSYHYYCIILSVVPVPGNSTIPIFDRVLCDDVEGPAVFSSVEIDLAQIGGSSFLTEFGGCDESPTCDEQLDWGLDGTDEFLQSWAYWGNYFDHEPTIKRLSRVYARAIAGKPLSMQYIASQRSFYLSYYVDPTIKQPTEIYVSPLQYPAQSFNVTVNRSLKWTMDPSNANIILVQPNEQFVKSKYQAVIGVVEVHPTM
ncbi:unnamed protein product [Rotaria magnacalcarata]|uniref:Endoglycoceramidase n=1 Tax=Rotaria magnacalcarata TaxID=392030 RepID=A0A819BDN8_9BILA|nr:unnamed protein product [Rotaria magnacalcarata]CAF3796511.1 unnamed protein product [Rotaria magnacalcarata]